jgi:hypothetical protein
VKDVPEDLPELQITGSQPTADAKETVDAIVKVRVPDYVPPGVHLRARVDARMFTATMPSCELPNVQADPNVESVEVTRRLRIVE